MKAFTAGYTSRTPDQLLRLALRLDALVFDIRFAPRSRVPHWQKEALEKLLGSRYRWVHDLGNRNYANGGPIELVDPARGLETVYRTLDRRNVILLCACAELQGCHRSVV